MSLCLSSPSAEAGNTAVVGRTASTPIASAAPTVAQAQPTERCTEATRMSRLGGCAFLPRSRVATARPVVVGARRLGDWPRLVSRDCMVCMWGEGEGDGEGEGEGKGEGE